MLTRLNTRIRARLIPRDRDRARARWILGLLRWLSMLGLGNSRAKTRLGSRTRARLISRDRARARWSPTLGRLTRVLCLGRTCGECRSGTW